MKVHVAVVAVMAGLMALTAAASSVTREERKTLVPMAGASLVKCETKTKKIDCNTCEYSVCRGGSKVWKDSIMRCTAINCSEKFDLDLDEEEIEEDFI